MAVLASATPQATGVRVGWGLTLVAALMLAVDPLIATPGRDLSAFIYVAQGVPVGELPYVDRWDQKGPLTYLLTLIGVSLGQPYGIWILGSAFLVGSTWCLIQVARSEFGVLPALAATALFLIAFRQIAAGGGLTEHYAMLFQCLSLFLFRHLDKENAGEVRDGLLCVTIGALGAATFLLRPNLVGVWLAIGLCWIVQGLISHRRVFLSWICWSVAGGVSAFAVAALVMVTLGMWPSFWSAIFVYGFTYSDASLLDRLNALVRMGKSLNVLSFAVAAGWCIGLAGMVRDRLQVKDGKGILILSILLLPIETILLTVSGYSFSHYYIAALPATFLAIGFSGQYVERKVSETWFLALVCLIALIALLAPMAYLHVTSKESVYDSDFARLPYKYMRGITNDEYTAVSKRVRSMTEPDDPILVWGNRPQVYIQADRTAPSRFFAQWALINRGYADESIRSEFMLDILNDKPRVIVDINDTRLPSLDKSVRGEWVPSGRRYLTARHYELFFALVDSEYEAVEEVDRFVIYMHKGDRL